MREDNIPKDQQSASDDSQDNGVLRHTVFSTQDVMQFQMIEGTGTEKLGEAKQSLQKEHQEIQDMSVGWYASPQDDDLTD